MQRVREFQIYHNLPINNRRSREEEDFTQYDGALSSDDGANYLHINRQIYSNMAVTHQPDDYIQIVAKPKKAIGTLTNG